jgi:hypothetical protein
MTVCRDVPADLQRNWQNLGEMYTALGVRRSSDAARTPLAPPATYADSQTLSYMVGPSGGARRSINIAIFNDPAARACLYQWAGYDETAINARITAIRGENPDNQEEADAAVQAYLQTLPPLQQQIYRVVGMITIFQQDYRLEGGVNVGGGNRSNPDTHESADPNVISDYEIQQYAAEALEGGDENPEYEATGGRILSGISGVIGLMTYLTTPLPTPVNRDGGNLTLGNAFNLAAPDGGWRAGDHVFVGGTEIPGVPTSGGATFTIPVANLPLGNQSIEIRRDDGAIVRTAVAVTNPPPPPESGFNLADFIRSPAGLITGALSLLGLGGVVGYLLRGRGSKPENTTTRVDVKVDARAADQRAEDPGVPRSRERRSAPPPPPPAGGETRVVSDTTTASGDAPKGGATRVVSDTTAAPPPQGAGARTVMVAADDGDMADLTAALNDVRGSKSPVGGITPSVNPSLPGITADNVIIRGKDAPAPVALDTRVVMSEIAYLNPRFLTQDGTAIHSNFRPGVERLAGLAMKAFQNRSSDAANATELWMIARGARDSMVDGGIPEAWLREFVRGQLEKWAEANDSTMGFDPATRERMERDAERRAGERGAYERWIEDALRDPARLAGR